MKRYGEKLRLFALSLGLLIGGGLALGCGHPQGQNENAVPTLAAQKSAGDVNKRTWLVPQKSAGDVNTLQLFAAQKSAGDVNKRQWLAAQKSAGDVNKHTWFAVQKFAGNVNTVPLAYQMFGMQAEHG